MTSVLLIEDSRTDAMLIKSCLKLSQMSCTFVVVERLADAEIELKRQFDVAIVDLNLPDSSGMETVRRVRELRSDLPIVVFSGDADDEKGVLAMREGAQDFILKQDFNRSTLERSVRFAIERHQRQVLSQRLRERDTEYHTARDVQQRLMPREFPTVPGYELAGRCRSAEAVGGDFFDFVPWPDGRLGVVIGDVSGHGFPAALLMASTRRVLRALKDFLPEPGDLIAAANRHICDDTRFEQFVEVFLAVVDPEIGQVGYVGAGHGAVLIRQNGEAVELGGTGLPAGMTADLMMDPPGSFQMEPGDLLAVYTDGLYECRSQSNQMLGQETVISLLKNNRTAPLDELINSLIEVSCNFCEPDTPCDDITIAMVRYVGHAEA